MGYADNERRSALDAFRADYASKTRENRKILDHLLHDAFRDDAETEPEVDLVNDPDPPSYKIGDVLGRYPFRDVPAAYRNLMALATERTAFLSPRRCRHFLASIAPRLLKAISATPEPDATLVQLTRVSDSIGGKGALWELLSANAPSLNLYVTLCAACPYLASILTSNPGMIDELVDSLLLERLPTSQDLDTALAELCRGAEDLDPILHSFKDAQHLRVGVRDILGKDSIEATHAALSDTAEACLKQITLWEYARLLERFGPPTHGERERYGVAGGLAILALGKLGGREPNYHSNLEVLFLYDADETPSPEEPEARRADTLADPHFQNQLAQRIVRVATQLGPFGRLYEVDPQSGLTGRSGALAVSLEEFRRYFAADTAPLPQRLALCQGRVICASHGVAQRVMQAVTDAAYDVAWNRDFAAQIRDFRLGLEKTAAARNLKRGPGGTMDVELLVQMLQLRHGRELPSLRVPGTLPGLKATCEAGVLDEDDFEFFNRSYRFLRSVEARIRLMNAAARHDLPDNETELAKLAFLLNYERPNQLEQETQALCQENRRRFEKLLRAAAR
jgi:glutamate-ammonia-ligase adenylyltransferase